MDKVENSVIKYDRGEGFKLREKFPWEIVQNDESKFKKYRPIEVQSWDAYFMLQLKQVASRSSCLKKEVAAIVVKNRKKVGEGYNGVAKGLPHPMSCPRLDNNVRSYENDPCACLHSEINALIDAGKEAEGATLYCQYFPCKPCLGAVINAGIKRIVYDKDGGGVGPSVVDDVAIEMAQHVGIDIKEMTRSVYGGYAD